MSTCQRCKSARVLSVCTKSSDLNHFELHGRERNGYVLGDLGVGEGDYLDFEVCLDCGQMQGEYPRPPTIMETTLSLDEFLVAASELPEPFNIGLVRSALIHRLSAADVKRAEHRWDGHGWVTEMARLLHKQGKPIPPLYQLYLPRPRDRADDDTPF